MDSVHKAEPFDYIVSLYVINYKNHSHTKYKKLYKFRKRQASFVLSEKYHFLYLTWTLNNGNIKTAILISVQIKLYIKHFNTYCTFLNSTH